MEKLFFIIANADPLVIKEVVFMYGINSLKKNWMDKVRIIFWGPSQLTLINSPELQEKLNEFRNLGGEPWACKRCAEDLGTFDKLLKLNIHLESVGTILTEMLKEGWHQLTF
jgi:hypothetical protein